MALKFRPHTWTVQVGTQPGSVVPQYGSPQTVRGQISGISSETAFSQFGVEVTRGFELLCNIADATYHKVGYKVTWNTREFIVKSDANTQNHGMPADHSRFLIEEVSAYA
jgi:hypothetical protein